MITLYRFFLIKKKTLYIGFLNKTMLLVAVKMIYFLCQLFCWHEDFSYHNLLHQYVEIILLMLKGKKKLYQILFLIDTFLVAYVKAHWHFFTALYVFRRRNQFGSHWDANICQVHNSSLLQRSTQPNPCP